MTWTRNVGAAVCVAVPAVAAGLVVWSYASRTQRAQGGLISGLVPRW